MTRLLTSGKEPLDRAGRCRRSARRNPFGAVASGVQRALYRTALLLPVQFASRSRVSVKRLRQQIVGCLVLAFLVLLVLLFRARHIFFP